MDYPQEIIKSIAGEIGMGMICFLNVDTIETGSVPCESYDTYCNGGPDDIYREVYDKIDQWEHCIRIEPLGAREFFKIMEDFIEDVIPASDIFKDILSMSIYGRHPFHNFKFLVETSPYRQDWFAFKQQQLEIYVRNFLESESEEE
ncbi:hypothetical protein D0T84_00595 [Dysgonomonas sp. 521]|uniref:UPF0158 family protein n=1 Tax=Dysgonomonas sp. 521 TaxID=2302932 RepID=UPI0013D4EF4A|nr:UPF0158 family protein [Dysgonomonas sp. 521]NDV93416.1 hypothetical protein [Dysgonomonas sp. 521]